MNIEKQEVGLTLDIKKIICYVFQDNVLFRSMR